MKNLFDIGERNIVQDIIYDVFPYLKDFGGWELVFSCKKLDIEKLERLFNENGLNFTVIGYVDNLIDNRVFLHKEDGIYKINDFSSRRFDKMSMFSFGLKPIIDQLYKSQLEFLTYDNA